MSDDPDTVPAVLYQPDGTPIKTIPIPRRSIAPRLLIEGEAYYLRTSPDGVASPLEYERLLDSQVLRV